MNTYTTKTNKQLIATATALITSVTSFNKKAQQFVGDFIVSYGTTHDSTPFSRFLTTLASDKRLNKTRYQICKWVQDTTNYKVVYNKEKNTYTIKFQKDLGDTFTPHDDFYTTNFYDEDNSEKEPKEYTLDDFKKSLDKLIKKAIDNGLDVSNFIK